MIDYPPVSRSDFHRRIAATDIPDPFHWLEDHTNAEVHQWALHQDQLAGDYLHTQTRALEFQAWLEEKTQSLPPVWRASSATGEYFFAIAAGESQPVLMCSNTSGTHSLLNCNGADEELNPLLLSLSPSGRYLCYVTQRSGEPMGCFNILDTRSGAVLETSPFRSIEPQLAWLPDESGYFYCLCRQLFQTTVPCPDGVYRHALGGDWQDDVCVLEYPGRSGAGHNPVPHIPPGSDYLFIQTQQFSSGYSGLLAAKLPELENAKDGAGDCDTPFVEVIADGICFNRLIGTADGRLYIHTCLAAPNGKIVALPLKSPVAMTLQEIIAEGEWPLAMPEQGVSAGKHSLIQQELLLTYVEHAHDVVRGFSIDGKPLRNIDLPEYSTIDAIYPVGGETVIFSQSFLRPRGAWRGADNGVSGNAELLEALSTPSLIANARIEQVFYHAADGTLIPMYLLAAADADLSSIAEPVPTMLYAYGGFGQTIAPEFTAEAALWLQLGGVYALANIRGGGEYGKAWHDAAIAEKRQVAFDDFYAAAEFLIEQGVCTRSSLAIKGISNGGLLSAVAVNQRPELFAAVITEVPMADLFWMMSDSIGSALVAEYGDPVSNPAVLAAMLSYSPLQNVKADPDNPPQLIVVAEKDPSAQPGQVYKYLAARQVQTAPDVPVILRIIYGEGHTDWPWPVNCRNLAEQVAFAWQYTSGERS